MAVLKYWDDPDMLFNQYMVRTRAEEKKKIMRRDSGETRKMIEDGGLDYRNLRTSVKSLKGTSPKISQGRSS